MIERMDDERVARAALREILEDKAAPAAARAAAARTLLELAGRLGPRARDGGDELPNAFEMTRADLNAELDALDPGKANGRKGIKS